MQLITHKFIPPTSVPKLSTVKAQKYVYRLGVSCCPSMDLVATYPALTRKSSSEDNADLQSDSEDEPLQNEGYGEDANGYTDGDEDGVNVQVWRFNGQCVFSVSIENEDESQADVTRVEWRHDGQILAVLSADNTIRLVNSFSGKIIHRFSSLPTHPIPPSPTSPRTRRSSAKVMAAPVKPRPITMSYTTHFANPSRTHSLLQPLETENLVVLDDLLSLNANIPSLLKSPADLPRELANIDVESFLPRLSCLPPIGFGKEDVFSTRISIDAIFHASKKNIQRGNVDVLFTGQNDGTANIRIFDSFEVGSVDLNAAAGIRKNSHVGTIVKAAGWPFSSQLIVAAEDVKRSSTHLFGIDLKFITHSSNVLPILATKATQLQNLLRYLAQIQSQLAREVKTAFDLPTRFLRNVNEDLEGQDGSGASFKTAAYHSIVTGETTGVFKEWLSEQVGDRGVKRWEKSVGECLELVRRLVSESWCPAVERAGVVVSRLNGLAGWTTLGDSEGKGLGLDLKVVEDLGDTLDVMAICGEECLKEVVREISGFTSFIKWLKWEVEAGTLEDTSEKLDEMREASDHGEVLKILEYIEKGPEHSVVAAYLDGPVGTTNVDLDEGISFYASFKEQRKRQGNNTPCVTFGLLLDRMRKQCERLFEQIAYSLQKGIATKYITQLSPDTSEEIMDMRVIPYDTSKADVSRACAHVLARKRGDSTSLIHHLIDTSDGSGKVAPVSTHIEDPPESNEILDAKFVDDIHFMVLVRTADGVRIYSRSTNCSDDDEWELRHRFKDGVMEAGMRPAQLDINGRKKRRIVSVVDEDAKGFVILDLDSGDHDETPRGEDEVMTG